ncbi:hypothetical protein [Mesorhizobium sp.]|uniref:hypothetical protein n=1 Tax=Mesorhizobium sp. TaxID=1871066 RepID=UPI00257C398E|nr:hypothetical protein [Mesorhizobium sp.]
MADLPADLYEPRSLWQPNRHEQLAACEILLASKLPIEARFVIRDLEQKFRTERHTS